MSKLNIFYLWFKQTWAYKPILILIVLILFTLLMDKLIMPMVVDLGNERELPDIIEMSLDQAKNILEKEDFNVIVKDSLYDANYPLGTVIEQNPYPYATVKEGRRVYLTISIGEKPIIMPKLIGLSPRDATLTIKSYNLKMGSKSYTPSDIYLEGTVIGQSYPQGKPIKPPNRINIKISLGKRKDERFGVEILSPQHVISITPCHNDRNFQGCKFKTVLTESGQEFTCTAVLVATGSNYRQLIVPGSENLVGISIHYCATCDGFFYKNKDIFVIGGGNSAFEESLFLKEKFANHVTIIVRGDEPTASPVLQDKVKDHQGIDVLLNTEVHELTGENKLETVRV